MEKGGFGVIMITLLGTPVILAFVCPDLCIGGLSALDFALPAKAWGLSRMINIHPFGVNC